MAAQGGSPVSRDIGVLQWPAFPGVEVEHVNAFDLALNDLTGECEITLGRINLPVGPAPTEGAPGLTVQVVGRIVVTQVVLQQLSRAVTKAADLALEEPA